MDYKEAINQQYTAKECQAEIATHAANKAKAAALWINFIKDNGHKMTYSGATILAWLGYAS